MTLPRRTPAAAMALLGFLLIALWLTSGPLLSRVTDPCLAPFAAMSLTRYQAQHRSLFHDTSWHRYVDAPNSSTVFPKYIVQETMEGDVHNAGALVGEGGGPTVLTRWSEHQEEPVLVLDFGRNVVGLVIIEFEGSKTNESRCGYVSSGCMDMDDGQGSRPGIKLSFSETMWFMGERSDFSRSYNVGNKNDKMTDGTDQIRVPFEPSVWLSQLGCQYPSSKKVCSDGLHGFRYLRVSLSALASDAPYTQPLGQVSIKSVQLRWSAHLGTPDSFRGWFECSDTNLTQYWYRGVYTNDLCTDEFRANETEPRNAASPGLLGKLVIHDGAKRDRDPYVGDLAVSALTTYLTRSHTEAVSNVLEDLGRHQRDDGWIPPASIARYRLHLFDYPLWWVVCVYHHTLYTGNTSFLERLYPKIKMVLDKYYHSTTNETVGLLQKGMGYASSQGYGDYAFLPRRGVVTYYNALYVLALQGAARLSSHPIVNAYAEDGRRWTERATAISEALRSFSWDEMVGAFWDGQCHDGSLCEGSVHWCPTHAQDGNALAIIAGIAPVRNSSGSKKGDGNSDMPSAASILHHLTKTTYRGWGNAFYDSGFHNAEFVDRVYPFISHFEISSRFLTPRFAPSALDQIRRTYGTMLSLGPGTFWEGIGKDGTAYEGGYTSMAHGWSSGVVSVLTGKVLGVEPGDYGWGWKRWRVRPLAWEAMFNVKWTEEVGQGGFKNEGQRFEHFPVRWARGVVPTLGHARIGVMWDVACLSEGDDEVVKYTLSVSGPQGTTGEIWIPFPTENDAGVVEVTVMVDGEDIMGPDGRTRGGAFLDEEMGYVRVIRGDWGGDDLVKVFEVNVVHRESVDGGSSC